MSGEVPRRIEARRGFSLSYKGKTLLSLVDPAARAERITAGLPVKGRTLYFCPSPLYGYGIGILLDRLGPGSAILCVETDERLMEISTEALAPLLTDRRLALVRTADPAALCARVQKTWGSRVFRRVETLRLSGGWMLDGPVYEALASALIRDIALDWGNAMTLVKLGRRYTRNTIRNLSLIPRALSSVDRLQFPDRPLLVLGAGPSLDEILPALRRFFGPGLGRSGTRPFGIICADTALPVLRDRDIRPDLAVALESQQWNLRDFIGLGDWKIPAAMDLSALPATGGVLGGEILLFVTPWAELAFFRRLKAAGLGPEILPPLGSVGLTAAALALRLSRGPVIAAGLDFSFTLDRFHARATPGHRDRLDRQNRFRSILNAEAAFRRGAGAAVSKSGLPVRTDPALKNYRDLFEREFGGEERFRDIEGPGLPLGLKTVSMEEACILLTETVPPPEGGPPSGGPKKPETGSGDAAALRRRTEAFIREERESLTILRDMLSGVLPAGPETLGALLDRNDYLWACFPECAAAGGRRPPLSDISFLKRVRVEIDPLIKLFDLGLKELVEEKIKNSHGGRLSAEGG